MKNSRFLKISLLVAVSLTLFFISQAANAQTRKESKSNLAAELNLVNRSLSSTVDGAGAGKDRMKKQLRGFLVPLKEGVKAFCDFTPPVARGLETMGNRTEYRAVIGFHFRLK